MLIDGQQMAEEKAEEEKVLHAVTGKKNGSLIFQLLICVAVLGGKFGDCAVKKNDGVKSFWKMPSYLYVQNDCGSYDSRLSGAEDEVA